MNGLALYVLLASISPMLAALVPMLITRNKKELPSFIPLLLLGVSSGMLFAVASLDLIPEGIQIAGDQARKEVNIDYVVHEHDTDEHDHEHGLEEHYIKIAVFGIFCGFLLMMLVEQVMSYFGAGHSHSSTDDAHHHHDHQSDKKILSSAFSMAALVGLAVHSLVDGVMIGGAFSASSSIGTRVGIAIVLHKFPDGFMLSSILQSMVMPVANRRGRYFFENIGFFVLAGICFMTPIGALLSFILLEGMPDIGLGFILCFGSGTFLFITCSGIIPELLHQEKPKLTVGAFISGYFLFLITDSLFHAH